MPATGTTAAIDANVDDVTLGPSREHARDERSDAVQHAPEVHAQHCFPVGEWKVPCRAAPNDPCVVAHDVDCTEPFEGFVDEYFDCDGIGDIADQARSPVAADARDFSFEALPVDVGHHDSHSRVCERLSDAEADAARGAGHDRPLALDASGHVRHSANAMPQPVIASVR